MEAPRGAQAPLQKRGGKKDKKEKGEKKRGEKGKGRKKEKKGEDKKKKRFCWLKTRAPRGPGPPSPLKKKEEG